MFSQMPVEGLDSNASPLRYDLGTIETWLVVCHRTAECMFKRETETSKSDCV